MGASLRWADRLRQGDNTPPYNRCLWVRQPPAPLASPHIPGPATIDRTMLTKRIIPCFDVAGGRVVTGVRSLNRRDAGDPVELARMYDAEGADELVFLDIRASPDRRDTALEMVQRIADQVFIPFTVGGGIRTPEDVRLMLESGADKVAMNTAAVENPDFVSEASHRFCSQCIVVAIDAKRAGEGRWQVHTYGGVGGGTPVELDAVEWAARCAEMGAGELLIPGMDDDGPLAR